MFHQKPCTSSPRSCYVTYIAELYVSCTNCTETDAKIPTPVNYLPLRGSVKALGEDSLRNKPLLACEPFSGTADFFVANFWCCCWVRGTLDDRLKVAECATTCCGPRWTLGWPPTVGMWCGTLVEYPSGFGYFCGIKAKYWYWPNYSKEHSTIMGWMWSRIVASEYCFKVKNLAVKFPIASGLSLSGINIITYLLIFISK